MGAGMQEKMSINPKTGEVHIPSVNRSGPGHPKGSFRMTDAPNLKPRTGKVVHLTPGREDVWAEYKLASTFLTRPKKYQLSLRFLTNEVQEPLKLVIKKGNKELETLQLDIPNTNNKWQTLDPVDIGVELGGAEDTTLKFSSAKPVAKFMIRDFYLTLQNQLTGEYSMEWMCNLQEVLQKKAMESMIPNLDETKKKTFQDCCGVAFQAKQLRDKAKDEEAKKGPQKEFNVAMGACLEAALPMMQESIESALEKIDFKSQEGKELLQAIVLAHGTPCELGHYAGSGSDQKERIKKLLQDADFMLQMLLHGGPRGGNYGRALDIHAKIESKRQQGKSVLSRLSLAVALEFAEPHHAFQQKNVLIDPIERYLHYETAYLEGELDPAFESLTVWELRNVVNSDAPNEQLSWFRETIWNYHPGIATMDDYHWRYAWIVRTDVHYKQPEWLRTPHCYRQLLSGGGMCGPRAWMGRFSCKAFGNPTWGVRQPAHAAISRWTPSGWETALGGGFRVSWWEDVDGYQDGLDFECEAKIRGAHGDETYFRNVALLDWIGDVVGERKEGNRSFVVPNKVWPALAITQRRRLSKPDTCPKPTPKNNGQCEVLSRVTEYKSSPPTKETITTEEDGRIVVPIGTRASATSGPCNIMKSCLGGHQAFVKPGFEINFKLPQDKVPEKKAYNLSVKYVTVHETDLAPLLLVASAGDNKREYEIPISADWRNSGKWQNTEPIQVELGGADENLKLSRKEGTYPLTLKDFTLSPC